jgi:hypothetical protein
MTIEEILNVTQTLTFEERKKLIFGLFDQMPRTGGSLGTIEYVGDFEAGKRAIRDMVNASLENSARQITRDNAITDSGLVEIIW